MIKAYKYHGQTFLKRGRTKKSPGVMYSLEDLERGIRPAVELWADGTITFHDRPEGDVSEMTVTRMPLWAHEYPIKPFKSRAFEMGGAASGKSQDEDPFKFHTKPSGWTGAPCPICGCPAKNLRARHRALKADEAHHRGAPWIKRVSTGFGMDFADVRILADGSEA